MVVVKIGTWAVDHEGLSVGGDDQLVHSNLGVLLSGPMKGVFREGTDEFQRTRELAKGRGKFPMDVVVVEHRRSEGTYLAIGLRYLCTTSGDRWSKNRVHPGDEETESEKEDPDGIPPSTPMGERVDEEREGPYDRPEKYDCQESIEASYH